MWIFLGLLGICLIYVMLTYNSLIKHKNLVEEAYATMDVYLKKRADLIPNLINTVKGYASHEQATFEKVITARSKAIQSSNIEERATNENTLSQSLKSLFALGESYPDLKADNQFLSLQDKLTKVEEDIAKSRKYYNAVTKELNTKIQLFPANLIASSFGFKASTYFSVNSEVRDSLKVEF